MDQGKHDPQQRADDHLRGQQPRPSSHCYDANATGPDILQSPSPEENNIEAAIRRLSADESKPASERTRTEIVMIMLALCTALLLAALDSTIVTTAAPTISAQFDSNSGYVWIGSAYLFRTYLSKSCKW
jgi:hypothetical protein